MNTINSSTKFSGFQLHLGCLPCMIPSIMPNTLPDDLQDTARIALTVIQHISDDIAEAHDNLLLTKITQAHHASASHGPNPLYNEGDLATANCRHKYKKKGEKQSVKFFP
jgi:hypothetical protein